MFKRFFDFARNHLFLSRRWIGSVAAWITWDFRYFWVTVIPIASAYVFVTQGTSSELALRAAGVCMEILGIATVAWGIRETRQLFDKPTAIDHIWLWLGRFPRYQKHTIVSVEAASMTLTGGNVGVSMWLKPGPNADTNRRISALEANLDHVRAELQSATVGLQQKIEEHEIALADERTDRTDNHDRIETKLEASETGGLHISAMGLCWLLTGIPLTVFPNEIAMLLS